MSFKIRTCRPHLKYQLSLPLPEIPLRIFSQPGVRISSHPPRLVRWGEKTWPDRLKNAHSQPQLPSWLPRAGQQFSKDRHRPLLVRSGDRLHVVSKKHKTQAFTRACVDHPSRIWIYLCVLRPIVIVAHFTEHRAFRSVLCKSIDSPSLPLNIYIYILHFINRHIQ